MSVRSQRPSQQAGVFLVTRFEILAGGIAFLLALSCDAGIWSVLDAGSPRADPKLNSTQVQIYDVNPTHLWNRLHSALFVRTTPEGESYGHDELDPLLWAETKFLLAGEHHQTVVALLDEFLAKDGERLVKDPLKRAVFQHDLWAIFDWLANPKAVFGYRDDAATPEQRALQVRLAKIIRRVALSAKQIEELPDNYAAAITSKTFPTRHNRDRPETAFLPAELFQADGPWVLLGEHMKPAAPVHARFVQGRSAFLVFMNLPEGRMATRAYLEKLGAFPKPLLPQPADQNSAFLARNLPRFNPELPQFPAGTQVALVREMLLIDDKGQIRPTRIIESIQIRVYRDMPKGDPAHPEGFEKLASQQDFYEFRATRKDLFAETSGGLHAVGPQEGELIRLNPHPDDKFETEPHQLRGHSILQSCSGCHRRGPGIHSVEAYRRSFIQLPVPALLREHDRDQQEEAAMLQKWENYSWGLLQGFMERQ